MRFLRTTPRNSGANYLEIVCGICFSSEWRTQSSPDMLQLTGLPSTLKIMDNVNAVDNESPYIFMICL